jgi:hypothetical protein
MTELAAEVLGDALLLLFKLPLSLLPPKLPLSVLLAAADWRFCAAVLPPPMPTAAASLLSWGLMLAGDAWLLLRDGGAA